MDSGAWQATVHGGHKSWTWLNDYQLDALMLCVKMDEARLGLYADKIDSAPGS